MLGCLLGALAASVLYQGVVVSGQALNVTTNLEKQPGLFYAFGNGQVTVIDCVNEAIVKTIPYPNGTTPYPNNCTGTPYYGAFADGVLANGAIFIGAAFGNTAIPKPSGVNDTLFIFNTTDQTLVQRVPISNKPVHIYYVPFLDQVWVHSDGEGVFDVIDATNLRTVWENVAAHVQFPGHGKLLFDPNLNGTGYVTNVKEPGVFILDLTKKIPKTFNFINMTSISLPDGTVTNCPGTHSIAYSPVENHGYVQCVGAGAKGNLVFDVTTNKVVAQLAYSGHNAVSPDQNFLTILDSSHSTLFIMKINPAGIPNLKFNVSLQSQPGEGTPAFYALDDAYLMAIPLLNQDVIALVDFRQVLACGVSCSQSQLASLVFYPVVGYQNPPGQPATLTTSRSVDAGYQCICTPSLASNGVGCYNVLKNTTKVYSPIYGVTRAIYGEGTLRGVPQNLALGKFDCAAAPLSIVSGNPLNTTTNGFTNQTLDPAYNPQSVAPAPATTKATSPTSAPVTAPTGAASQGQGVSLYALSCVLAIAALLA